jgi:hypothetical protein
MDDAPYTDDVDLAAVRARDDLRAMLRLMRTRADDPSVRTSEARTRPSTAPVSKTVVSEMLRGARFPAKTVMVSFPPLLVIAAHDSAANVYWESQSHFNHRAKRSGQSGIHLCPPARRHGERPPGTYIAHFKTSPVSSL